MGTSMKKEDRPAPSLVLELATIAQRLSWRPAFPESGRYDESVALQCSVCWGRTEPARTRAEADERPVQHAPDCLVSLCKDLISRLPTALLNAACEEDSRPTTPTGRILHTGYVKRAAEREAWQSERAKPRNLVADNDGTTNNRIRRRTVPQVR
jgi:hypothetical protein